MKLTDFLKQYAKNIDPKFIDDFFGLYTIENKHNFVINLNDIAKWLVTRKADLKDTLKKSYIENIDYTVNKINPLNKTGKTIKEEILLTPKCFKLLSMSSKTSKAKEVRLYYFELEEWLDTYKDYLIVGLNSKISKLENNQKTKCNENGGYIYVIQAADDIDLIKLGKTTNLRKRMENYTADKGDNIIPLLKYKVNDIDGVEICIKGFAKKYQYRRRKEIYKIDTKFIDKIIKKCIKAGKEIKKIDKKHTLSRAQKGQNLFLVIYK